MKHQVSAVVLPYLETFRLRGKSVAYYRRDGVRVRLRAPDGKPVDPADSATLAEAWTRAHAHHEAAIAAAAAAADARIILPRSLADLIARYRASPDFQTKKPATRLDYEKGLGPLERHYGRLPIEGLQRHHVTKIRDRYAWRETPDPSDNTKLIRVSNARQANRAVTVLSILLSHAIDPLGWRQDNPALRPRRLGRQTEGYQPWRSEQYRQFHDRSDAFWRFAALLALLTGQRGQDLVAMRWTDYDGAGLHVVQEKGGRRVRLWIPAHPVLKAELDRRLKEIKAAGVELLSTSDLTLLARDGKAWPVNAFQKAAGKAIRAAEIEGVVWHGLRGASASWGAEGGASDQALAALLGHRSVQTTRHYSRGADQRRLAGEAVNAIVVPIGNEESTPSANSKGAQLPTPRGRKH